MDALQDLNDADSNVDSSNTKYTRIKRFLIAEPFLVSRFPECSGLYYIGRNTIWILTLEASSLYYYSWNCETKTMNWEIQGHPTEPDA